MTIRGLRFFWGYRDVAALHDYAKVSASDLSSNSRVLVNPQEIQRLKDVTAFQPPAYVDSPPETWKIEKRWKDTILYRVQ
jgi:hypothetical protein